MAGWRGLLDLLGLWPSAPLSIIPHAGASTERVADENSRADASVYQTFERIADDNNLETIGAVTG
jgi:hypothetical protein